MIASSTTMPMERITANSVIRLMLNPSNAIAANAPMMVTGMVTAGIRVARGFCRKTKMTMRTRKPASNNV